MSVDVTIGTATGILGPFAELLTNPAIVSIIALIYALGKFESWVNRKAVLGKYEQELVLEKEKADLRKQVMKGKTTDGIDFDKIVEHFTKKANADTDGLIKILETELDRFDLEKWR